MTSKQAPPLSVRLPEDDEQWLRRYAADAGMPVNAVLRRIVRDARATSDPPAITPGR